MKSKEETSQVKFYADTEIGGINKLFTFPVHNYEHAIDIIIKFKREGAKIRAAFFQAAGNNFNVKITPKAYEKDEFTYKTFSEKKG
ncbi:MAG TPA: hypothetical protein PLJ18_12430 [Niabella sp.]|nr:hypothetical protein [Niabella sp.]